MKQLKPWLLIGSAALVLVACGGGGGGGGETTAPPMQADPLDGVPSEATQSVSGWITYLTLLVMSTNADERDPAAFPAGTPSALPVDDESEPATL
jgi:hypothetical protein